jgi:hypothetical protein
MEPKFGALPPANRHQLVICDSRLLVLPVQLHLRVACPLGQPSPVELVS